MSGFSNVKTSCFAALGVTDMTTRTVTMSHTELDRFGVITRVRERRLTQVEAARILDLGVRQVQRLAIPFAHPDRQ